MTCTHCSWSLTLLNAKRGVARTALALANQDCLTSMLADATSFDDERFDRRVKAHARAVRVEQAFARFAGRMRPELA